jgi:hypothetical protein
MRSFMTSSLIRMIKSRRMRWAGRETRLGEKRNIYRILMGRHGGKKPLGKPRHIWEDNIKMNRR